MATEYSDQRPFPLSMADEGKLVKVVVLSGGKRIVRRLGALELNNNSILEIIRRQGNSLVIGRNKTRFALGTTMAQKIMVVPV